MIGTPRPTLGQMVYTGIVLVLLVLAAAMMGWAAFESWRARSATARADKATSAANTAQANATSANAGAANATTTRAAIDAGTVTVRVQTEQSAGRIETHANRPVAANDRAPVDADVLRELEDAEGRARAAADRLQRTHPR